jgi:hypothetical protein
MLTARQFFAAYRELRLPHQMSETQFLFHGVPAAVNGALALELYLKCFVALEGHPIKRTHRSSKLYGMLSTSNRERIARAWTHGGSNRRPNDVSALLAAFDAVFVNWRYLFEQGDLEISFDALDDALLAVQRSLPAP